MNLSAEEKRFLIKTARNSIKSTFVKLETEEPDLKLHPHLKIESGAFVTLKIKNRLRGCIGYIISDKPLYETVKDAALQAAFHDPRFAPLNELEFEKIKIEISVLSPPFKLNSYDEIEIGKHGLILNEKRRGLLLPQVPVEHHMNRDEFLSALCEKAGYDAGFWKEKLLNINMFTAAVFSEEDLGDENG